MTRRWVQVCLAVALITGLLVDVLAAHASSSPWREAKSEHFIVRYQNVPESFVQDTLQAAEEHYRDTITTLGFTRYQGWTWDKRVKIVIYDSQEVYVKSSHYGWSGGQVDPAAKEIVTFPSESGFFDSLLPHELGHIIFREGAGFYNNIPLWLEEGVAMYQEKARRIGADDGVRSLIAEGAYIPLAELHRMALYAGTDRATVRAFYTEAASLVGFLINRYEVYRFARLCRDLRDGQSFSSALKKAYMEFSDLASLEKAWRRYLNETGE
jgi:hypothetical protein